MTRRPDIATYHAPVFVTAEEAARRLMIGVETFRAWVQAGTVPSAAIDRGQIMRWHWPTIEARLAGEPESGHDDPFMRAIADAARDAARTTPKKGRNRAAA